MSPAQTAYMRSLRFASLALERGWVNSATFHAAMTHLEGDHCLSLEQLWRREGVISAEQAAEIERQLQDSAQEELHLAVTDEDRPADTEPPVPGSPATGPVGLHGGELANVFRPRYRIPDRSNPSRGGIGQVFKGIDLENNSRTVAIKELLPRYCDVPYYRYRLCHEARMLGKLASYGIPPLFGQGCYAAGDPFYAMQWLEGDTFNKAIDDFHADTHPWVEDAGRIDRFKQLLESFCLVCKAIEHTHTKNIVHLDIKPANIILHDGKFPYIADWGMAQEIDDTGRVNWDEGSSPGGTTAFMSPEVAGEDLSAIGKASDVFSLGATLYYLLNGKPPYEGSADEVREKARRASIDPFTVPLSFIPTRLSAVCQRAMAFAPRDRFVSPGALAQAVNEVPALALEQVTRLASIAGILRQLAELGGLSLPYLRQQWSQLQKELIEAKRHPREAKRGLWEQIEIRQGRLALTLFVVDKQGRDGWLDFILDRLLNKTDPWELMVLRQGVQEHATTEELERLNKVLLYHTSVRENRLEHKQRRFCALVALAGMLDLNGNPWRADAERQREAGKAIVDFLFQNDSYGRPWVSGLTLADWTLVLEPVKEALLSPLKEVFRNPDHIWVKAADWLLVYMPEDAEQLGGLIYSVDIRRGTVLWKKLWPLLDDTVLLEQLQNHKGGDIAETVARRRGYAGVELLKRGRADLVWPHYANTSDPYLFSYLIHLPELCVVDPHLLADRFRDDAEGSLATALLLALGDYHEHEEMDQILRDPAFRDRLLELYRSHPDADLHSAIDWMLTTCADGNRPASLLEIDADRRQDHNSLLLQPPTGHWYVNSLGQTFAIIDPPMEGSFLMGTPDNEPDHRRDEGQHRRALTHRFALGTRPVTVAEYLAFADAHPKAAGPPDDDRTKLLPDAPVVKVSWFQAAAYCNWLSARDGIPPEQRCYEPTPDGMRIKRGWRQLVGYRLPTEAEWEYACRAGTTTCRYWGDIEELIEQYAWYRRNSNHRPQPVGRRKPNPFGLFDMLGNVWEWCQDAYRDYAEAAAELDEEVVTDTDQRVLRGGSIFLGAEEVRAGQRQPYKASDGRDSFGFRVCRTWIAQP